MRVSILLLFTCSFALAQGEYLRHTESGFVLNRVISLHHTGVQRGVGIGVSFYGRFDLAMMQDDRHTLFDDVNGYSVTYHLMKQTFDERDQVPFSLALSASQTDADIRTYSFIPYSTIIISSRIELFLHAGIAASRQVSTYSLDSEYLYSFPIGASVMVRLTDWAAVGLDAASVFSKVYPGFGFGATVVISYDHHPAQRR